jgi:tetratricopeptide (TPR) repeat protein
MAQPQNSELTPAMQEALHLLRSGKTVEAEELVLRAAQAARRKFGPGTAADAIAQNELASVLLNVGQLDRAIEAFTEAVSGPAPANEQAMRDRLSYLMNLGRAMQKANRLDEAEEALHKGLEGREQFYSREHAGYAFGLEPLAEVAFLLGKNEIALAMMDEVVRNFWRNGHDRVAGAIAIRALMLTAANDPREPFAGLEKLPDAIIDEIAAQVLPRATQNGDLKISRRVLAKLDALLTARLGESHRQTINTLITITNVERKLANEGDTPLRLATLRRLIGIFDRLSRHREALQSVMGLALAQSEAGVGELAIAAYEEALSRVDQLGDAREKSQVLRNYGLWLAEIKRDADAENRMREAIAEGEKSGDSEMAARAMVALGIYLQHSGRLSDARPLLSTALPLLDPTHPDALTCNSHLQTIDTNGSCGCGDMSAVLADAFREFVMSRLPAGLLKQLDVKMEEGDFTVGVHLARQATEEELQHLNRVTHHALEEFRRKIVREN